MQYRVLVHGDNLELLRNDEISRLGFYATRVVNAEDPDMAKRIALESVWQDEQIAARKNSPNNPPYLQISEVEPVRTNATQSDLPRGFTFYELEDDSSGKESARTTAYRIEKEANG